MVLADEEGRVLEEISDYIGEATNNVAEYWAFIRALERARELGATSVVVQSDSELLVRQVNGEYRVKDAGLKPLHARAMALMRGFERASVQHLERGGNRAADTLAGAAVDRALAGTCGTPRGGGRQGLTKNFT